MQTNLRIVFLDYVLDLTKPGRNGLSDIVWDMASEMIDLGHEVHVVAPYTQQLAPDQRVKVHSIEVPPMGYRWFIGHMWICKRMADIAFRLNPDVIHAPEYLSTAIYNSLYPSKSRKLLSNFAGKAYQQFYQRRYSFSPTRPNIRVMTVPGNIYHRLRARRGNPFSFFFTQCLKWAAHVTATTGTVIVATSQEMKEAWEDLGSPAYLTPMIPYGINHQRFYAVRDAKTKLGINSDEILLLYVGRLSQEKAIVETVQTISKSQQVLREGKVKLQIFGNGPQTTEIASLISQHNLADIVKLDNWVDQTELPVWYSAADAVLLPSYTEGFGRVITEAMICGSPVIGSNIAGARDHITAGQNGYLFEMGDFECLGQILEDIAKNPEVLRQMREFAQEYVRKSLTWSKIVQRVIDEGYLANMPISVYQPVKTLIEHHL